MSPIKIENQMKWKDGKEKVSQCSHPSLEENEYFYVFSKGLEIYINEWREWFPKDVIFMERECKLMERQKISDRTFKEIYLARSLAAGN